MPVLENMFHLVEGGVSFPPKHYSFPPQKREGKERKKERGRREREREREREIGREEKDDAEVQPVTFTNYNEHPTKNSLTKETLPRTSHLQTYITTLHMWLLHPLPPLTKNSR